MEVWTPTWRAHSVCDVTPDFLDRHHISSLLLDLDNTLVPCGGDTPDPTIREWIRAIRATDRHLCLVTNSLPARPKRVAQELQIGCVACDIFRLRGKPDPCGFELAMQHSKTQPWQTIMIGDQLLTDIAGANRCGLRSILVDPLTPRDGLLTRLFHRGRERPYREGLVAPYLTPSSR